MTNDVSTMERPFVRTPEQVRGYINQLEREGYEMARLDERLAVTGEKEQLARRLKEMDPTLNGNVDQLIEDIALCRQELETKKTWSAWEYVKGIPGRVWETMKAHPYISTAVVLGLGAAGAYYSGVGPVVVGRLRDWVMTSFFGEGVTQVANAAEGAAQAAQEAVPAITGSAEEMIGGALDAVAPTAPTPALPLPTEVPSMSEAADILSGLENGG